MRSGAVRGWGSPGRVCAIAGGPPRVGGVRWCGVWRSHGSGLRRWCSRVWGLAMTAGAALPNVHSAVRCDGERCISFRWRGWWLGCSRVWGWAMTGCRGGRAVCVGVVFGCGGCWCWCWVVATRRGGVVVVGFWWWGLRLWLGWCKFSSCCRSRLAGLVDWCGCGCVWWFENSIVCTVLLHHMADVCWLCGGL